MNGLLICEKPSQEAENPPRIFPSRRRRLDEAIIQQARMQLCLQGHGELRGIECECEEGKLTLRGCLSSFYLKQLAQETLRCLPGMRALVNATEVMPQFKP